MGLILDSSIVIAAERRGDSVDRFLAHIIAAVGDQDAALTSIGLTELVHGVFRAQDAQVRQRRELFVEELIRACEVYPYTRETALLAGRIDGEQQSRGVVIPFNDLLIGATALSLKFSVLTVNLRHFGFIPGLRVLSL